jgi:hypothetical protein
MHLLAVAPQPEQRILCTLRARSSISAPLSWRTKPFSIMNAAKPLKRPCLCGQRL